MRITFILIVAISFLLSCNNNKEKPATETKPVAKEDTRSDDSTAIRKTITDFYNWYNKNYTKLMDYKLYSGIKKKDTPPYKFNWDVAEKYQAFIRDSIPQLGQAFLDNQKKFFQQCDSAFKKDTEDEIPYGFDFDWYTNSQEDTQYLLDEINKQLPWNIKWSGDEATVDVQGEFADNGTKKASTVITIIMKKENGQWKIAKTWGDL